MAGPESVEYLKLVRADGTEVTARVERRDREGNAWVYTLAPRDDSGRSWQVKVFPHENGVNDALAELTCVLAHLRHKASGVRCTSCGADGDLADLRGDGSMPCRNVGCRQILRSPYDLGAHLGWLSPGLVEAVLDEEHCLAVCMPALGQPLGRLFEGLAGDRRVLAVLEKAAEVMDALAACHADGYAQCRIDCTTCLWSTELGVHFRNFSKAVPSTKPLERGESRNGAVFTLPRHLPQAPSYVPGRADEADCGPSERWVDASKLDVEMAGAAMVRWLLPHSHPLPKTRASGPLAAAMGAACPVSQTQEALPALEGLPPAIKDVVGPLVARLCGPNSARRPSASCASALIREAIGQLQGTTAPPGSGGDCRYACATAAAQGVASARRVDHALLSERKTLPGNARCATGDCAVATSACEGADAGSATWAQAAAAAPSCGGGAASDAPASTASGAGGGPASDAAPSDERRSPGLPKRVWPLVQIDARDGALLARFGLSRRFNVDRVADDSLCETAQECGLSARLHWSRVEAVFRIIGRLRSTQCTARPTPWLMLRGPLIRPAPPELPQQGHGLDPSRGPSGARVRAAPSGDASATGTRATLSSADGDRAGAAGSTGPRKRRLSGESAGTLQECAPAAEDAGQAAGQTGRPTGFNGKRPRRQT